MEDERGAGWLMFASVILIFVGIMRLFDAWWVFRQGRELEGTLNDAVLGDTRTTYAWLYLLVGIVLILAGIGVLSRSQFSRWIGIIGAVIAGLSAMPWLPYYPVWSLIYIFIAVMVIYGLVAYGGRDLMPGPAE